MRTQIGYDVVLNGKRVTDVPRAKNRRPNQFGFQCNVKAVLLKTRIFCLKIGSR